MRLVTVGDLRRRSAQVWRRLFAERNLVVTSRGKPIALLTWLADLGFEEFLNAMRAARAMAAVDAMQRRSEKMGLDRMTLREINGIIADVRRSAKP